jgi:xyloglucan-specific exo-beta-1,4-glucanase
MGVCSLFVAVACGPDRFQDSVHNITLACLAKGIEETAVLGLVSPPQGAHLVSAVGDVGGWVHNNLDAAPPTLHVPVWGTVADLDFAGASPLSLVRIGNTAGQIATSADGGNTWTALSTGGSLAGGFVTYTANRTGIVWSPSSGGAYMSYAGGSFMPVNGLPAGAVVEADKANDTVVYASVGGKIYVSTDTGMNFVYTNQLGSATASRSIATSTLAAAGEFWVSTDHGIWHL